MYYDVKDGKKKQTSRRDAFVLVFLSLTSEAQRNDVLQTFENLSKQESSQMRPMLPAFLLFLFLGFQMADDGC